METSTLTNFLWIGGTILVVGAIFLFKSKEPEKPGSKPGPNPDPGPGPVPPPPPAPPPFKPNPIKAKKAFISHLEDFSKLLPTLIEGFVLEHWTAAIVTVNDPDLIGLWKKYVSAGEISVKWRQLLASWQVKSDTCRSFTCVTNDNMSAYSLPDGGKLTMNVKYKVESPCWVYTSEDNQGNVKKQIVIKGIVVPFES